MKFRNLIIIFCIALIIECAASSANLREVQYFSKPSLMVILIFYFLSNSKNLPFQKKLIIAALSFSWIGDVVLLFEKQFSGLFIFGLLSFLAAHIFYAAYFWQIGKVNLIDSKPRFAVIIAVLVYSVAFYFFLFPNVGSLRIPILIYMILISLMLLTSIHAFNLRSQTFGKICVAGTMLFTFSDSILAINRFVVSIYLGSSLVMLVYATSQLLITEGALRNLKNVQVELS